jgi:hypothetical protein
MDAMLNEVQKKIYGQRTEKLAPIEIYRLFQVPVSPEFNLVIYRGLQRQAINPDVTLLQAIPRAHTKEYLIPIALCLRYEADANMYVVAPQLGTIHILGYVYSVLGGNELVDVDVLNTIILMLIAQGSRPSMPMFDPKAGKIRAEGEVIPASPTVVEWLNEQGYPTILNQIAVGDPNELRRITDVESLVILAILLDNPRLMGREYVASDMTLAIRAFSPIAMDRIPIPTTKVLIDFKSLDDAVNYLNADAYEKLIKRGQLPSYLLINKILLGMRQYRTLGRIIAAQELERMLISSVSVGTQLDQDQINLVSAMGRDILTNVMKEYEQPYWRKACKSTHANAIEVPEQLRQLAISLNIDPSMSQAAICENITLLSKADKQALKEAAQRRQQLRIAADLGTVNEFMNGRTPTLVCRNKGLLSHDPIDYNDIDLAYYRDDQGAVWCFGSDLFANLLESGINPYNSVVLPESFKVQLRYRLDALRRLGLSGVTPRVPTTFAQSIDGLTAKDAIKETTSAETLNKFIQLAVQHGMTAETVRSLTKDRLMAALRSIGYDVDLTPLSTQHALVTVAYIITSTQKTDPDASAPFFATLSAIATL